MRSTDRRRAIRLAALALAACAAAACGGSSTERATAPGPGVPAAPDAGAPAAVLAADAAPEAIDYQEVDLPSASNFLPLLEVGAKGVGCTMVAEQAGGLAYQCEQGLIFMVQKGAKLRYACENTPPDQCGALMQRITAKMLEAAGR